MSTFIVPAVVAAGQRCRRVDATVPWRTARHRQPALCHRVDSNGKTCRLAELRQGLVIETTNQDALRAKALHAKNMQTSSAKPPQGWCADLGVVGKGEQATSPPRSQRSHQKPWCAPLLCCSIRKARSPAPTGATVTPHMYIIMPTACWSTRAHRLHSSSSVSDIPKPSSTYASAWARCLRQPVSESSTRAYGWHAEVPRTSS